MQELTVDTESSDLPENTEARMVAPEQQLGEQFDQSLIDLVVKFEIRCLVFQFQFLHNFNFNRQYLRPV